MTVDKEFVAAEYKALDLMVKTYARERDSYEVNHKEPSAPDNKEFFEATTRLRQEIAERLVALTQADEGNSAWPEFVTRYPELNADADLEFLYQKKLTKFVANLQKAGLIVTEATLSAVNRKKPLIFLIDDDEVFAKKLKVRAELKGYAVIRAENDDEAVACAGEFTAENKPDVIITGNTGLSLRQWMKAEPLLADVPTVMTVAGADDTVRTLAMQAGMSAVDGTRMPVEVLRHVAACLRKQGQQHGVGDGGPG